MEHDEMDVSRWADERLSSLEPSNEWRPDASAAFARLRRREAPVRRKWWLWATLSATAATACAVVLLVSTPSACANPLGCSQSAAPVHGSPVPIQGPPVQVPIQMSHIKAKEAEHEPTFKESGSQTAPVTCELYTDYECPHCAAFYLETLPQFATRYVETGKVRLIHRDFPLPQHKYARRAALYADAAGEAGYYDAVARKLFRTQIVWSTDGDIDGQVAKVVPPAAMEKVRELVRYDSVSDSVEADEAAAREKHVARTPTLLCNGQTIGPDLSFPQIEAQLDPLVAQR
jgi:protein-disulfide isomerase